MEACSNKIITLYGPYAPMEELERLENLINCLKIRGFNNINLVKDYPPDFFSIALPENENQRILEKSTYCLKKSDLNILVFTLNGINAGVAIELNYCINNKIDFLVYFELKIENGEKIIAGSRLIRGLLSKIGKSFISFPESNNSYLCDAVNSRIIDFFD